MATKAATKATARASQKGKLPLATLLSQALVAYTIEFDNEAEQRIPHITTVGRQGGFGPRRPWFVSQVMWVNFLRHVAADGTPVKELQALASLSPAGIKSRLHHLEWWQHLTIENRVVRLTPGGVRACEEWKPLPALVDKRWRSRFGAAAIDGLKSSLRTIAAGAAPDLPHLPDYLPVVDYQHAMRAELVFPDGGGGDAPKRTPVDKLDLSALLSRVLLALTLEFERESDVSLTISANVVRALGGDTAGVAMRDLPMRAGVAKEGVTVAVNSLKKNGYVVVGADKAKTVQLTAKGEKELDAYRTVLAGIEKRWEKAFGKAVVQALRDSLDALGTAVGRDGAPLLAKGLTPPPDGWRTVKPYDALTAAFLADPRAALPHHPMVLHRGGYPDGA